MSNLGSLSSKVQTPPPIELAESLRRPIPAGLPVTPFAALSQIIAIASKASANAGAPQAVADELLRVLSAAKVTIGLHASDTGPDRQWEASDRSEARPVHLEPSCRCAMTQGDVEVGVLSVTRNEPLSEGEQELVSSCVHLLVIGMARDARLHQLENEVLARVREVAQHRAFIERVVDSLPFGLYVVDREYRIHAWNHKRETGLQGVSRNDAIGRTIFEVLHRQPATLLKTEFDEVFATGRLQQFQMESDAFGDTRTFRISKIPMCVDGEAVSHVITVGEDITDWKAAIDRTAQSEKLAALGQLAAGVMHEINNPLATIAACGESLSMHQELAAALPAGATVPGANPAEMLRIIDLEVHRCKKIINGLLDVARPKPAQRETFGLNTVVQQGLFLLQHHPRFKRVNMVAELDTSVPLFVHGDADQLVQVLIALAMNAIDASPEGGRIAVTTRPIINERGEAVATFEVSDEGPGVPRSLQAKVFEPFFTTKPTGQGTGLGLAICYGIVNDHNGQLELVSRDGPGATFRVALPDVGAEFGVVR